MSSSSFDVGDLEVTQAIERTGPISPELPEIAVKRKASSMRVSPQLIDLLRENGKMGETYEGVIWRFIRAKPFDCLTEKEHMQLETIKMNLDLPDNVAFLKYVIAEKFVDRTKAFISGMSTVRDMYDEWVKNTAENLPEIKKGRDIQEVFNEEANKNPGACIIIGAGPSIERNNYQQLLDLAESKYKGTIIVCDRILEQTLKAGVTPDKFPSYYAYTVDSKDIVATWFDNDLVRKHQDGITMVSICNIHPNVLKAFKGKKAFFLGDIPETMLPNAIHTLHLVTGKTVTHTLGHVGGTAIAHAYGMLKNPICVIGDDLSYPEGTLLTDTQKFEGFVQMFAGRVVRDEKGKIVKAEFPPNLERPVDRIKALYRKGTHPFFKTRFVTDYVFDSLRDSVVSWVKACKEHFKLNAEFINATEGGCLWDEQNYIKCMYFKDFLARWS